MISLTTSERARGSAQIRHTNNGSAKKKVRITWLVAWLLIIAVTTGAGVLTRLSYTDFSSNSNSLMALQYWYIPYSLNNIKTFEEATGTSLRNPGAIIDDAEAIVECVFTGSRSYSYLAFLSQVKVTRVLKGDASLNETVIPVYEPMKIHRDGSTYETVQGDYFVSAQGAYYHGGTLMTESDSYVLFLKKRIYPYTNNIKKDEYVLCDNPFAKLSTQLAQEEKIYIGSDEYITVAESLSYEAFADNQASARDFNATKNLILQKVYNSTA